MKKSMAGLLWHKLDEDGTQQQVWLVQEVGAKVKKILENRHWIIVEENLRRQIHQEDAVIKKK